MKNIYLIPTKIGEGSLFMDSIDNKLIVKDYDSNIVFKDCDYYNLYITSEEKIKKKDYFLSLNEDESYLEVTLNNEVDDFNDYADEDWTKNCKKIILTTDLDLTKNYVQGVDETFLEWFVKNPSCEYIEVEDCRGLVRQLNFDYRIIIPQEDSKQETLEEASWKFNPLKKLDGEFLRAAFIKGAQWQAKRMYSEQDLREAFNCARHIGRNNIAYEFDEWFNRHKKK